MSDFFLEPIDLDTDFNSAKFMCKRIIEIIADFEETIKDDEQACLTVSSTANQLILINDVSYLNPNIIIFYGNLVADGARVQVLQHINQLNLCLLASKRPHPEKPRRKIGFSLDAQED